MAAYSVASYSSDPYTYGYSNNAASGGLTWSMSDSVFPVETMAGLDVNGVIYRYTAVKNTEDPFTVSVQNEFSNGNGYIFRETDDWSGRPGATINKLVPVAYTPIEEWGRGSIETTGVGSVENPSVVYTYRQRPVEVEVPAQPPTYEIYSVLDDPYAQTAETDSRLYEKDEDESKEEKGDEGEEPLEKALAASEEALEMAVGQAAMLQAMNTVTMTNYYAMSIPGGVYKESVVLKDSNLPDNRRALRSMANDALHNKMVEEQYK